VGIETSASGAALARRGTRESPTLPRRANAAPLAVSFSTARSIISILAVSDSDDENLDFRFVNLINDAIDSHANAIGVVDSFEFLARPWTRFASERSDSRDNRGDHIGFGRRSSSFAALAVICTTYGFI